MIEVNLSEKVQNEMKIDDFDYDVIKAMVGYLYADEIMLVNLDFAMNLLAAAEKYNLLELKEKCEAFASSKLTKENAWNAIGLARLHKAKKLFKIALNLINSLDEDEISKLPDC